MENNDFKTVGDIQYHLDKFVYYQNQDVKLRNQFQYFLEFHLFHYQFSFALSL